MTVAVPSQVSFKKILVASDFSDASEKALSYAKSIAKRFGSHLVLAHISDAANPIPIPEGGWIEDDSAVRVDQQVEAAGVALRAEGLSAAAVNAYGSVQEKIQMIAEDLAADLLVLGTHSRRGFDRLLFGSEAEGMIRHSDRPVLTVGPSAQLAQGEWTPQKVLCASSLDPHAARVVAYGFRLAECLGAAFGLLSVNDPRHPVDEEETWRAFEHALIRILPEEDVGRHQIRSLLCGKSAADNIIDVARTLKPDLIVMGARSSPFSTTHLPAGVLARVLMDAPCPVLTIATE